MAKTIRFVGLDVHVETIAVAVADGGRNGAIRSLGTILNEAAAVAKLVKKLGPVETLHFCYEAGQCGYGLYWQLIRLGAKCEVVAPTLIPQKAGDRVKTDRRDAEKLARLHRSGDLTGVWVPDAAHEALRDLVRAREAAQQDALRAKNRLGKFLLRQGRRRPEGMTAWSSKHMSWLRTQTWEHDAHRVVFVDGLCEVTQAKERVQRLEQAISVAVTAAPESVRNVVAALQAMRGIRVLTAATVVAELGQVSRFATARQLMAYSGLVPREHSSGGPGRARRGGITKTGNAHLRRVLVESAWNYRSPAQVSRELKKRQEGTSEAVRQIAWKAQHRLHNKYWRLLSKNKPAPQAATAVARELLGFIWAIAREVESSQTHNG